MCEFHLFLTPFIRLLCAKRVDAGRPCVAGGYAVSYPPVVTFPLFFIAITDGKRLDSASN